MNGSDREQQQLQLSWHLFFTTSHLRSSKWAQTALIHAAHNIHQCTLTPSENQGFLMQRRGTRRYTEKSSYQPASFALHSESNLDSPSSS